MFRRHGDQCVARFAADEVAVLRQVASEVIGLLSENFDRDDPVVERLFPDVYAEAWLRALNDVRLALGIRLAVRDDTDLLEELDEAVMRDPTSSRVRQLTMY